MSDSETERQIRRLIRRSGFYALICLPVIFWQAWRLNHRVLRLPEANGVSGYVDGKKPTLRILLIGESTAAGVGVEHNRDGLAGQLATALAEQTGRSVHWRVIGSNGYTSKQTRTRLCPTVANGPTDLVFIIHGFNDTVGWTSPRQWRREIQQIISSLESKLHNPAFILTGIPPFRYFPSLPEPTRSILALRADALELASEQLLHSAQRLRYLKLDPLPESAYYSVDGFHPSHLGYKLWAEKATTALVSDHCQMLTTTN